MAEKLLDYLWSLQVGSAGEKTSRYYSMGASMLKISEFDIPVGFQRAELPLMSEEMRLKKGVIIGAVERDGAIIIPRGNDVIHCGDRIIVLSESQLELLSPNDLFL